MKTLAMILRGSFFCFIFFLAGCATVSNALDPQAGSDQIAAESEFTKEIVPTQTFYLTSYSRLKSPGGPLTVYIEGDGRAWLSKNRLSHNPTPFHPMVLKLASLDPSPNVVYLARPCQYDGSAGRAPCSPEYWSDRRFSEEVIASMNEAAGYFSDKIKASEIRLVGYSGGAAVAVLLAARRQDVGSIRTLAGNLDPEAVNRYHHADALTESLDPMGAAGAVSGIPQIHFVGSNDTVVPPFVAENFSKASSRAPCVRIVKVAGATHYDGWTQKWDELLKEPPTC